MDSPHAWKLATPAAQQKDGKSVTQGRQIPAAKLAGTLARWHWCDWQAAKLELAVWRGCGWWAAAEYDERPITSSSGQLQGSAAAVELQNRESRAS